MPVYSCHRGDCDNLALQEPGCFVLQDALGRDWLCVETGLSEIPADAGAVVEELVRAQALAHKHGLSAEGSSQTWIVAPHLIGLRRALVLATYPPAAESRARALNAGRWQEWGEGFDTAAGFRASARDGARAVEAQGASAAEAWYRLAQKVLKEGSPMTPPIQSDLVPLKDDGRGGLRVGKSRVSLDTVINEYEQGADPEGIVAAYPTLELADVYAVIAYYLRHQGEVKDYLRKRGEEAAELRREIEARQPGRADLRARLLARRDRQEQDHASARG